ncbi:YxiF family protein [Bacillus sp. MM09(2025)]|uniref:YxiF family protein n=1 Tax=Bacillus sp. MM09(2025) TaxID=3422493 RepID=UPI003D28AFE7
MISTRWKGKIKVANMNNSKAKMDTLKRRSRRKHLMNELSYMTLPENAFLDIEENQLFCQKVFTFLQSREDKIQIHGNHYRERLNSLKFKQFTIITFHIHIK